MTSHPPVSMIKIQIFLSDVTARRKYRRRRPPIPWWR